MIVSSGNYCLRDFKNIENLNKLAGTVKSGKR
jgi:hypothetical protein